MKLLSFAVGGKTSYGIVSGDGVIDLGKRSKHGSLRSALAADAIADLMAFEKAPTDYALGDVEILTPVPDAEKIICIGINYKGHILEMGRQLPEQPSVFLRLHSSLAAPGQSIVRPRISSDFDYEGELAVVIGKGGRHITRDDAMGHIAGYTCFNDGSVRDYQKKGSLAIGKNFERTGSCGPWLVTADEIGDPSALQLETRLNGGRVQHTGVDDLIFDIPAIIAYVSAAIALAPGDIIATGTPEGVAMGRTPPNWMQPGDVVEVEISKIGVLRNTVAQES